MIGKKVRDDQGDVGDIISIGKMDQRKSSRL